MQQQQNPEQLNPAKLVDDLLRQKLDAQIFVCNDQSAAFLKEQARNVLNFHSIASIRCDLDNYKTLCKFANGEVSELSLFDSSRLINGFDQLTPDKLGIDHNDYCRLLEIKDETAVQWNEIVTPIKKAVEREVRAKIDRKIIAPQNAKIRPSTNLKIQKK